MGHRKQVEALAAHVAGRRRMIEDMAAIHIIEAELAQDIAAVLDRVQAGAEVVIERVVGGSDEVRDVLPGGDRAGLRGAAVLQRGYGRLWSPDAMGGSSDRPASLSTSMPPAR
jgi:hypothetical protein